MRVSFDPAKDEWNIRVRGFSFLAAADFDFEHALYAVETRYVALGRLGDRLHVLCFVETDDGIRVVSFRKANAREVRRYEKAKTTD